MDELPLDKPILRRTNSLFADHIYKLGLGHKMIYIPYELIFELEFIQDIKILKYIVELLKIINNENKDNILKDLSKLTKTFY